MCSAGRRTRQTSFAVLDAFVDAGGNDDRHRRRLFGLGAGPSRRRERDGDRPLAEARSRPSATRSSSRPRSDCWTARSSTASTRRCSIRTSSPEPATRRCSGSGSNGSTFITTTRTIRGRPLADSLGAIERLREGGEGPRDRPLAISPRPRIDEAMRRSRAPRPHRRAHCRPGTIWSSARSFEGAAACRRAARPWRLPFLRLANGFLTGKYRSKDDLGKSTARSARRRLSRRQGDARARCARTRLPAETGAAARDHCARLDHGAARRSSHRLPARPASTSSSELTRGHGAEALRGSDRAASTKRARRREPA